MKQCISCHRADTQSEHGRHDVFVSGLALPSDDDHTKHGAKTDDEQGKRSIAIHCKKQKHWMSFVF